MVVGVSISNRNMSARMADFLRGYDEIPLSIMWEEEERHILPAGCVTSP